jgi:hypothetical protein
MRADHELAMAIAKACGIPTDNLESLSFESSAHAGTGRLYTTHYVMGAIRPGEVSVVHQAWVPETGT